jgi:hypothetical protein
VRRGHLARRTGHPRLPRDPQLQSLTIMEDPMTADRVLPLGKTGKRLPGLINDLQLPARLIPGCCASTETTTS